MVASASCWEWFLQSMKTSKPTHQRRVSSVVKVWNLKPLVLTAPSRSEKQREETHSGWLRWEGERIWRGLVAPKYILRALTGHVGLNRGKSYE